MACWGYFCVTACENYNIYHKSHEGLEDERLSFGFECETFFNV